MIDSFIRIRKQLDTITWIDSSMRRTRSPLLDQAPPPCKLGVEQTRRGNRGPSTYKCPIRVGDGPGDADSPIDPQRRALYPRGATDVPGNACIDGPPLAAPGRPAVHQLNRRRGVIGKKTMRPPLVRVEPLPRAAGDVPDHRVRPWGPTLGDHSKGRGGGEAVLPAVPDEDLRPRDRDVCRVARRVVGVLVAVHAHVGQGDAAGVVLHRDEVIKSREVDMADVAVDRPRGDGYGGHGARLIAEGYSGAGG